MFYKRNLTYIVLGFIILTTALYSCTTDPHPSTWNVTCGTPYELKIPPNTPPMPIPADNPMTVEGVELGRHLFYEKKLSGDNSLACAGCHSQSLAFTDKDRFSTGIDGFKGGRNAMPIANLAYSPKLFWDGKANSLEELVLFPIQSEVEMHESVFKAVNKLQNTSTYPGMFYGAFCDSTITVENMSKALAQFMRSITSYNPNSIPGIGDDTRNEVQQRGFQVFVDETKGDCFHCHTVTSFTTNFEFRNNGLNEDPSTDPGLFGQTGNPEHIGLFKVPSLINLRHTAPYMHDGRFETIQQVIDFYDTGFHVSPTLSADLIKHTKDGKPVPRAWTERDKLDLLAFLLTLEDTTVLNNPAWSDPNE